MKTHRHYKSQDTIQSLRKILTRKRRVAITRLGEGRVNEVSHHVEHHQSRRNDRTQRDAGDAVNLGIMQEHVLINIFKDLLETQYDQTHSETSVPVVLHYQSRTVPPRFGISHRL